MLDRSCKLEYDFSVKNSFRRAILLGCTILFGGMTRTDRVINDFLENLGGDGGSIVFFSPLLSKPVRQPAILKTQFTDESGQPVDLLFAQLPFHPTEESNKIKNYRSEEEENVGFVDTKGTWRKMPAYKAFRIFVIKGEDRPLELARTLATELGTDDPNLVNFIYGCYKPVFAGHFFGPQESSFSDWLQHELRACRAAQLRRDSGYTKPTRYTTTLIQLGDKKLTLPANMLINGQKVHTLILDRLNPGQIRLGDTEAETLSIIFDKHSTEVQAPENYAITCLLAPDA